jgi:cell division protein ZapA (FtsZ GTPase activity inhibitor)
MSLLEIYIGKSKYTLDCEDHEKPKITRLASKLNERVNRLSLKMRGADEKTVLMLCSIMIEEELEALKNLKTTQTRNAQSISGDIQEHSNIDSIMSQNVENISTYIENLANKIKNY